MLLSQTRAGALLAAFGFLAALVANGCGDSSSSDGATGGAGSGGTAGTGGSTGGAAGAGNASGYCGDLPFARSCSYPVGSQDCYDFYGDWSGDSGACGFESVQSDVVCVVPSPVPVCVVRTCEVRWQIADAGADAGDGGVDRNPWQCPSTAGCDGFALLGSCDSPAEGRCVDHHAIVTDAAKARTRLESRCTAAGGTFSPSACSVTATTQSCRREQCTVQHDLFVEEAGFPTPCSGVEFAP